MDHQTTKKRHDEDWLKVALLFALAVALPLAILFLLPLGIAKLFWFSAAVLLSIYILWTVLRVKKQAAVAEPDLRMISIQDQPVEIDEVMDVRIATEQNGIQVYRGQLRDTAENVYAKLKAAFGNAHLPLLQSDPQLGASVLLLPRDFEAESRQRPIQMWKHWLLFFLTIITTTWAGALYQGVNLFQTPEAFAVGLPYSMGILAILGVHEMGHYFAAKHHGMKVTPPFFIPVPFALGTFGAFIQLRSPSENRRALFDVAVAGPLAGLCIAVPALWLGLKTSTVTPVPEDFVGGLFGSSFLLTILAKLSLGEAMLPGYALRLSPLGFAGWLGLLITALNLMPVGQLDGGHTARAMFGHRKGTVISSVVMWTLILLAVFVFPALMLWAIIVFFLARRASPPLNDITPLGRGRTLLGCFTFGILAMILIPFPQGWWK